MLVGRPGASRRCSTSSSRRPAAAPTRRRARRSSPSTSLRRRRPGLPRRRRVVRRRTARRPGSARRTGRFGIVPLADLVAPAAALAREGVASTPSRPTSSRSSRRSRLDARRRARCTGSAGGCAREGDVLRDPGSPTRSSASAPRARRRSTPATSPPRSVDRVARARRHADARRPRRLRGAPREPVRVALPRARRASPTRRRRRAAS